jgi:hypothetical protein
MKRDDPMSNVRRPRAGQVLVLVALALVTIVGGVGVVVEAGNAFAQQRVTQNGADAAANAGAVVLAERLGGAPRTDANVWAAIDASASANGLGAVQATYTDINGNPLGAQVGGGSIPPSAAGVHAGGTRQFGASFGRALGFEEFSSSADATAVTGLLTGTCPAEAGCGIIPITFPVLISTCAPPHHTTPIGIDEYQLVPANNRTAANMSIVPLCTVDAGSVGYLDLGSGNLATQIVTPTNKAFSLPTWIQTQTGNVNAVESAINDNYADTVVLIPMFDGTCRVQPTGLALTDCPNGQEGVGNNSWYHIPKFTGFWLERAYIQGNNTSACNTPPGSPFVGGNGSTACLKGWFVRFITQGPVGPGSPGPNDPSAIGIQLIK